MLVLFPPPAAPTPLNRHRPVRLCYTTRRRTLCCVVKAFVSDARFYFSLPLRLLWLGPVCCLGHLQVLSAGRFSSLFSIMFAVASTSSRCLPFCCSVEPGTDFLFLIFFWFRFIFGRFFIEHFSGLEVKPSRLLAAAGDYHVLPVMSPAS